jgi:3-oxoacyl-(acyl-carrier-protein) synthase
MVEVLDISELQLQQLQQHPEVEKVVEVETQEVVVVVEEAVDQARLEGQCPLLDIIDQQLREEPLVDLLVEVEGVEEVVEELEDPQVEDPQEVEDLQEEVVELAQEALHQVEGAPHWTTTSCTTTYSAISEGMQQLRGQPRKEYLHRSLLM